MLRSAVKYALALSFIVLSTAAASATTKLIMQLGAPSPDIAFSDIYLAQQQGYFKDEGLEVETRLSSGGALSVQIASSGGADIASATFEPYLSGYSKGLRGKYIFEKYDELIYYLAVPDTSDIKSIADLKGKHIGATNMASLAVPIAKSMLKQASVDPAPDTFVPVGFGNTAIVAIKSNQVQALAMWSSAFASLEQAGLHWRYFHHPTIGDIGNGGYFASAKTIEEKPEAIVGFLRAVIRAHIAIQSNPDVAIQAFWKEYPAGKGSGTPEEQHENALRQLKVIGLFFEKKPADQIGIFDMKKIAEYLTVMKDEGVMTSDLTPTDVVTNEFLKKATSK